MPKENEGVTVEMLQRFTEAFNAHDIDSAMSFMTDDCIFEAAAGDEKWGARLVGQENVASAFRQFLEIMPDAKWRGGEHFVSGDHGLSHWTFSGTAADGKRVEVCGCDVFTFRGDKIQVKNSYRKQRGSQA